MLNILLFGGTDSFGIPNVVQSWVQEYSKQDGVNFIVGDKNGIDSSFHKLLSATGSLKKSKLYCMDTPKNNKYELDIVPFTTSYNSDTKTATIINSLTNTVESEITSIDKADDIQYNRDWYSFIDKKLIDDCVMALCVWDGQNKRVFHMIQMLGIRNKPCYSFTI